MGRLQIVWTLLRTATPSKNTPLGSELLPSPQLNDPKSTPSIHDTSAIHPLSITIEPQIQSLPDEEELDDVAVDELEFECLQAQLGITDTFIQHYL